MLQRVKWCVSREGFPVALLFLTIFWTACVMPAQSDSFWQLRVGQEMWRSGRIMLHDEFTHTVNGGYWPNHEWLTQIVFYAVYVLGGLPLLTAFCAACVTAGWLFVARLTPGPRILRVLLVGAGAMLSSVAWSLRPQTLTLVLLGCTLWILVRRRHVWLLPPLFLVWSNLHGGVVLGMAVVAAAVAASAIVSPLRTTLKLLSVAALCAGATVLTPLGVSLWTEVPKSLARLQQYGVFEWRPPSLTNVRDLPFWGIGLLVLVLGFIRRRALRHADALTLTASTFVTFVLACRTGRNVPPFLLCAMPTIATLLSMPSIASERRDAPTRQWMHAAALATAALAGFAVVLSAWSVKTPRLGWNPVSDELRAALLRCDAPLYNTYDDGGYLIWFVRDRKVFVDSRQDPFPQDFITAHIGVELTGEYHSVFDRYRIGCALTTPNTPLDRRLRGDGWSVEGAGANWTVFRRPVHSLTRIGERATAKESF